MNIGLRLKLLKLRLKLLEKPLKLRRKLLKLRLRLKLKLKRKLKLKLRRKLKLKLRLKLTLKLRLTIAVALHPPPPRTCPCSRTHPHPALALAAPHSHLPCTRPGRPQLPYPRSHTRLSIACLGVLGRVVYVSCLLFRIMSMIDCNVARWAYALGSESRISGPRDIATRSESSLAPPRLVSSASPPSLSVFLHLRYIRSLLSSKSNALGSRGSSANSPHAHRPVQTTPSGSRCP